MSEKHDIEVRLLCLAQMLNLPAYRVRSQVVQAIRAFFIDRGFLELETPTLIPAPSTEPFLEVFETELKLANGATRRAFLPTSPEFAIKRLLSEGVGSCFEITKSFRNGEDITERHNPEFTILEWYHTPGDYRDVMSDTEELFRSIYQAIYPQGENYQLEYQQKVYDLSGEWERISVAQAFEKFSQISIDTLLSDDLIESGRKKGYAVTTETTWEEIYTQILMNEIEPNLGTTTPTFLYDYPVSQAAFSKRSEADPRFAERFEVYLAGWELGNAFTELTDATEQRARCLEDLAERERLGKVSIPLDEAFLQALEKGIPPTGGIAMGVDRIAALFANTPSIQDVLLFPAAGLFSIDA